MKEQIFCILVCALFGVSGGALYDVFSLPYRATRLRALRCISDALFCVGFGILFLLLSVRLRLPDLRAYMFFAILAGFFLYLKSFHKIVAFFVGIVYNRIGKIRKGKRVWRNSGAFRKRKRVGSR